LESTLYLTPDVSNNIRDEEKKRNRLGAVEEDQIRAGKENA